MGLVEAKLAIIPGAGKIVFKLSHNVQLLLMSSTHLHLHTSAPAHICTSIHLQAVVDFIWNGFGNHKQEHFLMFSSLLLKIYFLDWHEIWFTYSRTLWCYNNQNWQRINWFPNVPAASLHVIFFSCGVWRFIFKLKCWSFIHLSNQLSFVTVWIWLLNMMEKLNYSLLFS